MVEIKEIKRKICLIGDSAVGKTSLIRKFVLDQFNDKYLSTLGSKVYKKRIKYQEYKNNITDLNMIIWDVMGQEEFKISQNISFRDTHGALLVCDITRKETMENLLNWKDRLFGITQKIPIIILANKIDLIDSADFPIGEFTDFCKDFEAKFFFTSAKTGKNVAEAFMELGRKCI